jgi:hypothetical protein
MYRNNESNKNENNKDKYFSFLNKYLTKKRPITANIIEIIGIIPIRVKKAIMSALDGPEPCFLKLVTVSGLSVRITIQKTIKKKKYIPKSGIWMYAGILNKILDIFFIISPKTNSIVLDDFAVQISLETLLLMERNLWVAASSSTIVLRLFNLTTKEGERGLEPFYSELLSLWLRKTKPLKHCINTKKEKSLNW